MILKQMTNVLVVLVQIITWVLSFKYKMRVLFHELLECFLVSFG